MSKINEEYNESRLSLTDYLKAFPARHPITYKKPKFKVGDIVVYFDDDREQGSTQSRIQSKIIRAYSLVEQSLDDRDAWFYVTEQIDEAKMDALMDSDIIDKLN